MNTYNCHYYLRDCKRGREQRQFKNPYPMLNSVCYLLLRHQNQPRDEGVSSPAIKLRAVIHKGW